MIDLTFLKALRDKLKGGNMRSIHLNVLPGRYATRLDIADLNYIQPNLAEKFIETLLTKPSFNFPISFDGIDLNTISSEEQKRLGLLSKRLNSINIENEDNYKEHGIRTFGFGFPILIKPSRVDPTKIIKAPLFIWSLEIIKATNKVNTWSILRNKIKNETGKVVDEDIHAVGLNEVLLSFLKTDENISLPQINEDLLEDSIIDRNELIDECYKVLSALSSNLSSEIKDHLISKLSEPLKSIPVSANLESISGNIPWIYFGGVFGLFRTQKESIVTDIDLIIQRINEFEFENVKIENYSGTPQSAVETDPSQQEILNTLGVTPKKIIQGPPGTGKSQSLTALITNALANNLKCLVVCEKKTALDVIKNNLSSESSYLGSLAAVIEDINKDRDGIVNSVRDRLNNIPQNIGFNKTQYTSILQRMEVTIKELNNESGQLYKEIYQGKRWPNLVGEYLKRQKVSDHTILESKLDHRQFKFIKDGNELDEINKEIKTAKNLFKEVNRLDHPLEILNDEIFKEDQPISIKLWLESITKDTTESLKNIKTKFYKEFDIYKNWLDKHYKEYYELLKQRIDSYKSFVSEAHKEFGELLFKNDGFSKLKINTLSSFSNKYRSLKGNRESLVSQISELKNTHEKLKYFDHPYVESKTIPSLRVYFENINELQNNLNEWYDKIEEAKIIFLQNFSSSSLHTHYPGKDALLQIEKAYDETISSIKSAKVFKRNFLIGGDFHKHTQEIETLLSEFKIITDNIDDFRAYYNWRKFYIELLPLHKKVIYSIIETNCTDWIAAFESWYYFRLLSTSEPNNLPKDDEKIKELGVSKEQLKKLQIQSIHSNWSVKQYHSLYKAQRAGINPTSLFNKRGSRGERRNSLRKIIKTDFQLFTDFFPVVMVSPSVCSSIVPLEEGIFDVVIFDEASQLRLEDTFPALLRGKIKIISGDSHQMPPSSYFQGGNALLTPTDEDYEEEPITQQDVTPSNRKINNSRELADSESLLVYGENSNYIQSFLEIHYRSKHPFLIDFSNHAFYGKRLIPMPAKKDYTSMHFIQVNGVYEDQVNKDEARQVVEILLKHIKPFENGKYPSVGIATFNLYQRNLILEEITKARHSNPEYDKRIIELGPDLFVKNLENIQGDERDIIILSTTFGKRADGSFRQNFGPILQHNGYKLLNVIITRAKYKVYICTSIPQENIGQYSQLLPQQRNNGRAVFYAYLAYAKAVSEKNHELKDTILKQLYEYCEAKNFGKPDDVYGSESPFEDEVYYRLAERIGQERLQQQYKIGGFRIDLVVKSKITGIPVIAIECDGAKYHSSNEAYAWDMFRQSQLEKHGFTFCRIWSTNWWDTPEKELRKLVDFIHQTDMTERSELEFPLEGFLNDEIIVPITARPETKKKVQKNSIVTVKNPEGKIFKVKFSSVPNSKLVKPDGNGIVSVYDESSLAKAILGREEGETCQLGMLEVYYEIIKVE